MAGSNGSAISMCITACSLVCVLYAPTSPAQNTCMCKYMSLYLSHLLREAVAQVSKVSVVYSCSVGKCINKYLAFVHYNTSKNFQLFLPFCHCPHQVCCLYDLCKTFNFSLIDSRKKPKIILWHAAVYQLWFCFCIDRRGSASNVCYNTHWISTDLPV